VRKAVDYVPRRAADLVTEALADTRVVVVNGARQVGKSTLAEVVLRQHPNGVARFLDDPLTNAGSAPDSGLGSYSTAAPTHTVSATASPASPSPPCGPPPPLDHRRRQRADLIHSVAASAVRRGGQLTGFEYSI
jgi:hypothetical protein